MGGAKGWGGGTREGRVVLRVLLLLSVPWPSYGDCDPLGAD